VGPRARVDDMEKGKFLTLLGLDLQPLGCRACSQLLSLLGMIVMMNDINISNIILILVLNEQIR
jgi:hypothetical protein